MGSGAKLTLIHAGQPLPPPGTASVFLAGPTPRSADVASWRPDLRTLPGFTTNVEFGLDVTTGRAVLGCPPDCPNPERNRYLIWLAHRHGVPVTETLDGTVAAALAIVAHGGQCRLPPGNQ